MSDVDRISLHFKYCALILVMIIITVATDRWTAQKDFTTYLSNAATMTSLVLGLVAIFYSYISNDGLSKSLGSIATVSADVRDSKTEIGRYVDLTKEAVTTSAANASLLKGTSEDVHAALSTLNGTLRAISDENHTLQALVASLPTRIDQLESKVGDVAKALGEKPPQPQSAASSTEISPRVVERFLARPALTYNLVTYAFVLAARTKKQLSMDALAKAVELNQASTMNGFLYAMHAVQLLSREFVEDQNRVYYVTAIHPDLDATAKKYIDDYIERNYSDKPAEKANWLRRLSNVEAVFA
jgi:hypothetical protein